MRLRDYEQTAENLHLRLKYCNRHNKICLLFSDIFIFQDWRPRSRNCWQSIFSPDSWIHHGKRSRRPMPTRYIFKPFLRRKILSFEVGERRQDQDSAPSIVYPQVSAQVRWRMSKMSWCLMKYWWSCVIFLYSVMQPSYFDVLFTKFMKYDL